MTDIHRRLCDMNDVLYLKHSEIGGISAGSAAGTYLLVSIGVQVAQIEYVLRTLLLFLLSFLLPSYSSLLLFSLLDSLSLSSLLFPSSLSSLFFFSALSTRIVRAPSRSSPSLFFSLLLSSFLSSSILSSLSFSSSLFSVLAYLLDVWSFVLEPVSVDVSKGRSMASCPSSLSSLYLLSSSIYFSRCLSSSSFLASLGSILVGEALTICVLSASSVLRVSSLNSYLLFFLFFYFHFSFFFSFLLRLFLLSFSS
ncbi:hypothetical protein TVAGG3_1061670 [Trichomonas vaginalis G3]|uniref:hypothetical protein n=1 Tax=Trichomonas vaginalis (strain ATCC PRA-98 / G3) TaxID=412133 RepID=UPI0021E5C493|nr:hypothetical protein TVAGG3_1061670 [Trichomonas vaginalis G3]KAI5494713.1 hypothetical protein TVAGG3_1061670 [Trichomonas vaginalis G3]